jgi:hypothetical protein
MSSPSTQVLLPTSSSTSSLSSTLKHELSDTENLANFPHQNEENEEEGQLSTDDEYDIELGLATLFPMCRVPVHRVLIPKRRQTTPPVPARQAPPVPARAKTAPTSPARYEMEERVTTPHPIAERAPKKIQSSPPPLPARSLMRALPLHPLPFSSHPPTVPLRSLHRTQAQPSPFTRDGIIFSPTPQRVPSQAAVLSSNFDSVYEEDTDLEEMVLDFHANRGAFSSSRMVRATFVPRYPYPSSRYPNVWIGSDTDADGEAREAFKEQVKLFDMADDGITFRNPFVDQGVSTDDLDDILNIAPSPATKVRKVSEESVERACDDESLLGWETSPKISPRSSDAETTEATVVEEAVAVETAPKKERGVAYDTLFGWYSFSLSEDEEGEHEEVGEQIFNPYGNQYALSGERWPAVLPSRGESQASDCSAPSRLPSSVPRIRDSDRMLYLPVENPWASATDSDSASNELQDAASEFFSGFDVEALVASTQDPGYELANTDERKGSPDHYILDPHEPEMSCKCYFCDKHYHPTLDILKLHDPSDWCHCSACEAFREK